MLGEMLHEVVSSFSLLCGDETYREGIGEGVAIVRESCLLLGPFARIAMEVLLNNPCLDVA